MKQDRMLWCIRRRNGIRLVDCNDNLCKNYLDKARSSLNMLAAAVERGEIDWIITTGYYARYFALYALLQKCGIKSEIHDCSIEAFRLFVDMGVADKKLLADISSSKNLRISAQYYVTGAIEKTAVEANVRAAREFALRLEEIIGRITKAQTDQVRRILQALIVASKRERPSIPRKRRKS